MYTTQFQIQFNVAGRVTATSNVQGEIFTAGIKDYLKYLPRASDLAAVSARMESGDVTDERHTEGNPTFE